VLRYAARRLGSLIPVLLVMATLVWVVMILLPGDPALLMAGRGADPRVLDAIRADFELDRPRLVQYVSYLTRLLRLDLGTSYVQERPVREILLERAWPSAVLAFASMGIALLVGIAGGVLSAMHPDGKRDRLILLASLGGVAVPVFWLGILLRMVFASWLGWLPVSRYTAGDRPPALLFGMEWLKMPDPAYLILPALTLAAFSAGYFVRVVRASLLDVLSEDFVRTARAKGLSRWTVLQRHALSHGLAPLATVAGLQLASLMGGAIATEFIFDWPGMGSTLLQGIQNRDLPVVSGCVIFLTLLFVLVNLAVDLGYAWLDPRLRGT
jgi:ABC-type dipeptide/oligopeptide/nickel transport system permease component